MSFVPESAAMSGSEVIALVSLIVSPTAALVAVWLTSRLTAQQRQREREDAARGEALAALGRFMTVVVDAAPSSVVHGQTRANMSPQDFLERLFYRWEEVREPLVLMSVAHPSPEVQKLAFYAQTQLEIVLERIDEALKPGGSIREASDAYEHLAEIVHDLGQHLAPNEGGQLPRSGKR
jgi:hypothetical protein